MGLILYEWSTPQISEVKKNLQQNYEFLVSQREEYQKVPDMIREAWMSVNSEDMNAVITVNVEEYDAMLKSLSDVISGLDAAIKVYEENEQDMKKLAETTYDKMNVPKNK